MLLIEKLKQIGLNESEATVYLDLLENGLSTPPNVSRRTKIARTNCYNVINSLISKNLISAQLAGKRKAYIANNPSSLIMLVEGTRSLAMAALPDLEAIRATHAGKPAIKFYSGLAETALVFNLAGNATSVCYFENAGERSGQLAGQRSSFVEKARKLKIDYNSVLISGASGLPVLPEAGLLITLDSETSDILVWDDYVAILYFAGDGLITLLKSKSLAPTLRTIHAMIARKNV